VGAFKIFRPIARRPDLSRDEFQDYFRHPHGTWARKMRCLRGYVQSHQIDSPLLDKSQSKFEAVSEIWLDGPHEMAALRADPIALAHLADDMPRFADVSQGAALATEETVLESGRYAVPGVIDEDAMWSHTNRPLTTKLICLIEGAPRAWFSDEQIALARRLGAFRQTACVAMPSPTPPAYLGVREFWWSGDFEFHRTMANDMAGWDSLKKSLGAATLILTTSERYI